MTFTHPVRLGYSEHVGTYTDGSPEWHAQRSTGIGGSDIASVMQVPGAFKSRYLLWLEKHGDKPADEPTPKLRRLFAAGHALEPVIADEFALQNPQWELVPAGSWRRTDKPYCLSNPDALLVHRDTGEISLLEIKASGRGYGFENGFPPAKYVAQVRWYAGNLGIDTSHLVCQIALGDYHHWMIPTASHEPVVRMEDGEMDWYGSIYYPAMVEAAEDFVNSLVNHVPPPLDGSEDTYEYMRASNPGIDAERSVEIPLELARGLHFFTDRAKFYTDESRAAKAQALQLMGDAKVATVDGVKVAYRQGNGRPTLYLARGKDARDLIGKLSVAA